MSGEELAPATLGMASAGRRPKWARILGRDRPLPVFGIVRSCRSQERLCPLCWELSPILGDGLAGQAAAVAV